MKLALSVLMAPIAEAAAINLKYSETVRTYNRDLHDYHPDIVPMGYSF